MAALIHAQDGVCITKYVGPGKPGDDRRRWQITHTDTGQFIQITATQLASLAPALLDIANREAGL